MPCMHIVTATHRATFHIVFLNVVSHIPCSAKTCQSSESVMAMGDKTSDKI